MLSTLYDNQCIYIYIAFLVGFAIVIMVMTGIGHILLFLRWQQLWSKKRIKETTGLLIREVL